MQDSSETTEVEVLEQCQAVIGYRFSKPELLRAALTHTSGANCRGDSNERMEFLGDSVLGLVTCEQLYIRFPEYQEGDMTKIKSAVVSRTACARFSQEIDLGGFLFLGRGLRSSAELPSNMLADVFESLVGAIYLDGGLTATRQFILKFLDPEIDRVVRDVANNNYKSLLQQIAQKNYGGTPKYQVLDEQGPDHARSFKIAVLIGHQRFPSAWGQNKKIAESRAAQNAIAVMNNETAPYDSDAN